MNALFMMEKNNIFFLVFWRVHKKITVAGKKNMVGWVTGNKPIDFLGLNVNTIALPLNGSNKQHWNSRGGGCRLLPSKNSSNFLF